VISVEHVAEDDLEQYALKTFSESACAALEEHLLICTECRERLQFTGQYLEAMHGGGEDQAEGK
jgi:hypothetical protein